MTISLDVSGSRPRWLEALRLLSLYGLALSLGSIPVGVSAALTLIWVWFVALLLTRAPVPSHPIVWLALAFALYCMLHVAFPQVAGAQLGSRWDAAFSWAQLAVMVPLAYALRGDQRLLLRVLLLALIGLVLGTLWRLDWAWLLSEPASFLRSRPGFGFPALAYALYAGTALIGLLLLRRRCWYGSDGQLRWWAVPLWLFALAVVAEGVVLTQARGSWLGLIVVGLLGIGLWVRAHRRAAGRFPRAPLAALAIGLLVLIGLNAGEIRDRLGEEHDVAEQLLRGQAPADQITSVTLRWHALQFGLERWLERPWLGWGPGASHQLMVESVRQMRLAVDPRPDALAPLAEDDAVSTAAAPGFWHPQEGVLKHLHNSYLELLAQLGLVGLGLWMTMAVLLLWSLYDALRRARLSADLGLFLMLGLLYLAIWSLFNFRMVNEDFRAYWGLLAGAALSITLFGRGASPGAGD